MPFRASSKFTRLRIMQRLDDTLELPLLPETADRVMNLRSAPGVTMADLVDIVESDPGLAAQVVSWASSSFYAPAGPIRSVQDAISRVLGFDTVMNLAVGLALGRPLKNPMAGPDGHRSYWRHANWQAHAVCVLTGMMPRPLRPAFGLTYLSGLLHNLGDLVLAQLFLPYHQQLSDWQHHNPDANRAEEELRLMGLTREHIAARLLENWGMPSEVTLAVRHQQEPDYQGPYQKLIRLVWLSRQLLAARGALPGKAEPVPQEIYQELGLNRHQVESQFDRLVHSRGGFMAMTDSLPAAL